MIVVTAAGDTVDVPTPTPRQVQYTYQVTLTGVDGSTWDLNNGPVELLGGVQGLFSPPPLTHRWRTAAALDGDTWTGFRTERRDLTLPVRTTGKTWDDWQATDTAFLEGALDPEGEAMLTVTSPDAVSKTLGIRYVTDGNTADATDPLLLRERVYDSLQVTSGWPFWRGDDYVETFKQGDARDFFVNDGSQNLFYITPSAGFQTAKVSNPGHVASWPIYTISGPTTTFSVGIGDSVVTSSRALSASESVTVETATRRIYNQDGDRVWTWMDTKNFSPVPRGDNIPLSITVSGYTSATSVAVVLPIWYRRPFAQRGA